MSRLYYTAPTDEAFEEMKAACIEVWGQYKDSPGGYMEMEEKLARIRDIKNIKDNFMYMLAMFDMHNQAKVIAKLGNLTKRAVRLRMIDGGNPISYLEEIGLGVPEGPMKDANNEVLKMSLLNIQVCSSGTIEEALKWVRDNCPAGTSNNWSIDDRPEVAPVACSDDPTRTHYVFTC